MIMFFILRRLTPRSTRPCTLVTYTTLCRSGDAGPDTDAAPVALERQPRADANADHPVSEQREQHRDKGIVQTAQHALRDDLRPGRDLEQRRDEPRTEERRVGKGCVRTCSARVSRSH